MRRVEKGGRKLPKIHFGDGTAWDTMPADVLTEVEDLRFGRETILWTMASVLCLSRLSISMSSALESFTPIVVCRNFCSRFVIFLSRSAMSKPSTSPPSRQCQDNNTQLAPIPACLYIHYSICYDSQLHRADAVSWTRQATQKFG